METKGKKNHTINAALLICLLTMAVTPMLSARIPMIFFMVLVLVWVVDALFIYRYKVPGRSIIILPFIILMMIFFYKVAGVSSAEWGNYAVQLFFYTSIWMCAFTIDSFSIEQRKKIAKICYFIILANVVSNIVMFYNLHRYTAWSFVGASKIEDYVLRFNLGSTSFVSAITFFLGIALTLCVCSKNRKEKLLYGLGSAISLYYLVVCSGRATTMILVIIMLLLFFLYRNRRYNSFIPIILVLILLLLYLFRIQIIDLISDLLPNQRMAVRIRAIGQYLSGYDSDEDYLGRIEIIGIDFSTWLRSIRSFCFGIGDHRYLAGHLNDIYSIGISGHSDYFDFLAQYGIIGFSLLNALLICLFQYIKTIGGKENRLARYSIIILLVFLLRSIVGSIFSMDIAAVMFIFFPSAICLVDERDNDVAFN